MYMEKGHVPQQHLKGLKQQQYWQGLQWGKHRSPLLNPQYALQGCDSQAPPQESHNPEALVLIQLWPEPVFLCTSVHTKGIIFFSQASNSVLISCLKVSDSSLNYAKPLCCLPSPVWWHTEHCDEGYWNPVKDGQPKYYQFSWTDCTNVAQGALGSVNPILGWDGLGDSRKPPSEILFGWIRWLKKTSLSDPVLC